VAIGVTIALTQTTEHTETKHWIFSVISVASVVRAVLRTP